MTILAVALLAGASGMPPRSLLPASALGVSLQSALLVGVGTLAGEACPQVQDRLGLAGWVLAAVLALLVGVRVAAPLLQRALR